MKLYQKLRPLQSNFKVRVSSSGIHLFNRITGLNILFDEILPEPALWAAAPCQVSIALTNTCDLSCSHCFVQKNSSSLNPELLINWLNELDVNGCLGVGFGGGEPTLYPHFADICAYSAKYTSLAVTFTTHGHYLNEKMLVSLKDNVHFLRVSMDGIGKTYEICRGRPFNNLYNHLHNLKYFAPFGINFLINKFTFPDLNNAIDLAENVNAAEFLLIPERPVKGLGGIDKETSLALKHWVREYRGTIPLTISDMGADDIPICNPLFKESGIQAYAHIDASGKIKKTSYDLEGVKIGSDGVIWALSKL